MTTTTGGRLVQREHRISADIVARQMHDLDLFGTIERDLKASVQQEANTIAIPNIDYRYEAQVLTDDGYEWQGVARDDQWDVVIITAWLVVP